MFKVKTEVLRRARVERDYETKQRSTQKKKTTYKRDEALEDKPKVMLRREEQLMRKM